MIRRRKYLLLAASVLLVAFIAALVVCQDGWHSIPTADIYNPTECDKQLRFEEFRRGAGLRIGQRGWRQVFTGRVPVFESPTPLEAAATKWLKQNVQTSIEETAHSTQPSWREKLDYMWHASASLGETLEQTWHVAHRSPDFVSLREDAYDYTGGAHGNHLTSCMNFQWRDGRMKPVKLAEFFQADSDWKSRICGLLLADLKRQQAAWPMSGEVTTFKVDYFNFTAAPGGLEFYFDPYTVGPYAQGRFVVKVPFAAVKDLLETNGPAKVLGVK